MPDLKDGEVHLMQGSGKKPYELKNVGGVYSCSCPAWRNQSLPIESRTCKHLRKLRGDDAENARIGATLTPTAREKAKEGVVAKNVPALLLAHSWDGVADISGWYMSEKLDGVRAYWDGEKFISRLGNVFHAPDYFCEGLPKTPLDGELWMARKKFQVTSGIVRRQDKSDLWKQIRYMIFDSPNIVLPFEKRMEVFGRIQTAYAMPLEHQVCKGIAHLREELARVEALGAEGLMLRQPGSHYDAGRSNTLLKVKSFKDEDATVIGHEGGKGKHKGVLGSLRCRMANGVEFSVGTGLSDAERRDPPPIGSVIIFRFQELTDGNVPRFPVFIGVRGD
jgi:DNA ligase-1